MWGNAWYGAWYTVGAHYTQVSSWAAEEFDTVLTYPSPGSFKVQCLFPSHVLSYFPAFTHKYLNAFSTHSLSSLNTGSSKPDPILDKGPQR